MSHATSGSQSTADKWCFTTGILAGFIVGTGFGISLIIWASTYEHKVNEPECVDVVSKYNLVPTKVCDAPEILWRYGVSRAAES